MFSFDEKMLVAELAGLSEHAQVAFAAAAATRQLDSFERFARATGMDEQRPREIALLLWDALQRQPIDSSGWSSILDEVMDLQPEEDSGHWVSRALAEDAISALAYAIRCMSTSNPQEAAWAARCAYEAADQAAIRALDVQPGSPTSEALIKSHEWVQRELLRQNRDLTLLISGQETAISELQDHAFAETLLTESEALSVTIFS
jgi:uncharacterized protein YjaG (DUF416 family)